MSETVKHVITAINYIENHLYENPDLDRIAEAVHYSKYYLHRMFTATAGLTIQTYVQRRRLTEAARLLAFSRKSILEIALIAGYESQQSFTDSFKAMYKKTPNQYRKEEVFYPLQLRYILDENLNKNLNENPKNLGEHCWKEKITLAEEADISEWMNLVCLVIDGFPHLDEEQYRKQLREYIRNRRAWILKEGHTAIGVMAFYEMTGSIDFLGVHPRYRKKGMEEAFCEKALEEPRCSEMITITTFREGDKADTGYREAFKQIGFVEGELLMEFGYPTQRFIL